MDLAEEAKHVFRNGSVVLYRLLKLGRMRVLADCEAECGIAFLRQIEGVCKRMLRPVVEIIRIEESQEGTFGVLRLAKEMFCVTLELPDRLNAPRISSIPAQQYLCARHASPRFGETFKVLDVPGRSDVLFHAGNTGADTEGCILLGASVGKLRDARAVLNSGATFRQFMGRLEGYDEFHLTIKTEF